MNQEETTLSLVKSLQELLNWVYAHYNVDLKLYQPGLEPLSVIGKTEIEIIAELKKNIFLIFSRFSKTKRTNMRNWACKNFFGLESDALVQLAERITALVPVVNCFKNDKEFSDMPFVRESCEYIEKNMHDICINMIINYIKEFTILISDFQNFTTTATMSNSIDNLIIDEITSPQTLSRLFRIFYEGDNQCYCTIADAIRSNQEKFVP